MAIFRIIGGIFTCTHWGVWAMAVVSLPVSIVLMLSNMANGTASVTICLAAMLLAAAVALITLPQQMIKDRMLEYRRFVIGFIFLAVAVIMAGVVYFTCGGFPPLDRLFI